MAHTTNLSLDALLPSDLDLLRSALTSVMLEKNQVLTTEDSQVQFVYFPINAMISLCVTLKNGRLFHSASIGRDGVLAAASALDGRHSLSRAVVQIAGQSLVCEAAHLKNSVLGSSTLLSAVLRHEQTLYAQAQQSTACLSAHNVGNQLSRVLLRARDLCGEDELAVTQELVGQILGVRRTSVTGAASMLQASGVIAYKRGKIQIVDLAKLKEATCECYGAVNSRYSALLKMDHGEACAS